MSFEMIHPNWPIVQKVRKRPSQRLYSTPSLSTLHSIDIAESLNVLAAHLSELKRRNAARTITTLRKDIKALHHENLNKFHNETRTEHPRFQHDLGRTVNKQEKKLARFIENVSDFGGRTEHVLRGVPGVLAQWPESWLIESPPSAIEVWPWVSLAVRARSTTSTTRRYTKFIRGGTQRYLQLE
ncbi:hypothetical protein EDB19DRAFT_1837431 [Suillus lakei]|nr:hypothetical protein EDB19DRAFT_1837431 [Suillus lakei]